MITTVVATIFVFGILVFVHEFGHFITAKLTGMKVTEFALGFGPKLLWKKSGETEYSIRVIPLGGYNKIDGMDPDEEQGEGSFSSKPPWARGLVIAAGSLMNFVLPVVLFTIVFMSNGIDSVSEEPVIGALIPGKPAVMSGVVPGDRVLAINGVQVQTWKQVVENIRSISQPSLELDLLQKNGSTRHLTLSTEKDEKSGRTLIGIVPVIVKSYPGFFESISLSVRQTYTVAEAMLSGLAQMITGRSEADLAGPIGVAQMAGQVAQLGFIPLLQFTAFLSINLGLINLLPIPVLDGGHITTLIVETIRRKPLNRAQMRYSQMIGMGFLLLIMLLATFKDITRLNIF